MSLIKMWGFWKCLELTRGTHHVATPHGGAAHPGPRLGMVWGPPGPPLNHSPPWTLSLPDHSPIIAQTRVLAAIFRVFGSPCSAHHLC